MAVVVKLVDTVPGAELVTVRKGGRRSSKELGRDREYLTPEEVERLAKATKSNRNGNRDWLMIVLAYRHGLRASELVNLRRDVIDCGEIHIARLKGGSSSVQPLQGDTIRGLRKLLRGSSASPFLFVSERDAPFTRSGFQKLVARAGAAARFGFIVHPHMLRHAAGYKLANDGVDTRTI